MTPFRDWLTLRASNSVVARRGGALGRVRRDLGGVAVGRASGQVGCAVSEARRGAVMEAIDVMRNGLRDMHGMLDSAVEGMTAEQFNFRPSEGGISAFFSLWHYVRTEDNIVNFVVQHEVHGVVGGWLRRAVRPTSDGAGDGDDGRGGAGGSD
jgi:hypothetical protein